jgi:hypothetical protein
MTCYCVWKLGSSHTRFEELFFSKISDQPWRNEERSVFSVFVCGDGRGRQFDIRACLLVAPLDLFLSIAQTIIVPLQIEQKKKKKKN